jgi:cation diffusion facilitator CzcD-associated flavoprotein CzcO
MHPEEKMAVFEAADSCGGTWGRERLYPGLKSNNMIGTYEYPDFPMSEEVYGVKPFQHIPGAVLHRYLTDYAKHFGVFDRIQFKTPVEVVKPRPSGDGWILTLQAPAGTRTVETNKLILATGLTSTPNMPQYLGANDFDAPFFHAKDFCKRAPSLEKVQRAVVVGGAKSAFDVAYAMVESGAEVDLIVRPDGHGPVWIAPMLVTPFKKRLDHLLHLRWMTWMSPCPWGGEDGFPRIRKFLHSTALGRWIVDSFWKVLGNDVLTLNAYDNHPEVKKLKPWHSAFWIGSGLSILNYDSPLFDMVREGKIRVHVENIDHLERKTVVLRDGTKLPADVLICSTGWKKESAVKFQGLDEHAFGLPYNQAEKEALNKEADTEVLQMFPRLKDQPRLACEPKTGDPLRLYRFMVPPTMINQRNIAFAGMVSTVSTSICASVQGLWIALFLHGQIDRLPQSAEEVKQEVMLHTQWGKWRYPCGYGASLPDFVFEALPYMDLLLKDMQLQNHRKSSWLAEMFSPYSPGDFAGLPEEWKQGHEPELAKRKML